MEGNILGHLLCPRFFSDIFHDTEKAYEPIQGENKIAFRIFLVCSTYLGISGEPGNRILFFFEVLIEALEENRVEKTASVFVSFQYSQGFCQGDTRGDSYVCTSSTADENTTEASSIFHEVFA